MERADEEVVQVAQGVWLVDGGLPVEDLAELIGEDIDDTDWNTAAGLVLGLLGRVPHLGDEVIFAGHPLRVTGLRGRRITRLQVARKASTTDS